LIFSSGYTYSFDEAASMRPLAVQQGVPPSAILLEQRSITTYDNVVFTRDLLREHGWTSVLLVSSPYHMRRALLVWHHNAPGIQVVPAPPRRSQFYDHTRGASLDQLRALIHEYGAIAAYWWRGWI
jgi:uncharacterized SAM-binding protein YcdF (DUF218 family)